MAAVLGISAYYHDAAAALVVDGKLVAAIQEERLSRHKHDPSLPLRAARACLAHAKLDPAALDAVVYYENPYAKLERVVLERMRQMPRGLAGFAPALASQLGNKLWVLDQLAAGLGVARARVTHVDHHHSHAASAFFGSGFQEAAVLTVDGVGEAVTTAIWHGQGDQLHCKLTQELPDSIGLLYAGLTAWLGFRVNADEYKVMGLAAYGTPRYRDLIDRLARINDDGAIALDASYFDHFLHPERAYGERLIALLGASRPRQHAWALHEPSDQRYADIAASLQAWTEDALLALARRAKRETGSDQLCLAGGVAHNARMIGRLAREAGFASVFVQPAAGDAGGALGAAWLGAIEQGDSLERGMRGADLGSPCDPARASDLARALGLRQCMLSDPAEHLAEALASGAIVGVMSGRFEWGPRALGQRSILAEPFAAGTRDRINHAIKRREAFRPFAPAVLASEADRYFAPLAPSLGRFMTAVVDVHEAQRETLQAVTHVDGSARVQLVDPEGESLLTHTLRAFARRTGRGVLLNTSLNVAGEPIASDSNDGMDVLLQGGLDALLVEDIWIESPRP